ncbi:MAG TPA: cupin domain-containing protein [Allosphingosinicella sp.]|nr:cupin domain-containing protein [Allosphingosinicella sp.]
MIVKYLLASAVVLSAAAAAAQTPPPRPAITRADLLRHDLSLAGHEAIQVRVDFAAGAVAPRHSHPGEELVYVLRGTLEYRLDGRPPMTLRSGDVLFIPAGAIHAVTNSGTDSASELATYIVDRSRPLITLAP